METTIIRFRNDGFSKRAYTKQVEVGKWFKFSQLCVGQDMIGYGKVVRIVEENVVEVEKYFELPACRPYAAKDVWYEKLPFAI